MKLARAAFMAICAFFLGAILGVLFLALLPALVFGIIFVADPGHIVDLLARPAAIIGAVGFSVSSFCIEWAVQEKESE